ncbi:MAG: hypothetical protein ABI551_20535, partial [Polyangiaceae bacterium]
RAAAAEAFQELDTGELSFALAEPATGRRIETGTWRAIEPGKEVRVMRPSDLPPRSVHGPAVTAPPTASAEAARIESKLGVPLLMSPSIESPIFTNAITAPAGPRMLRTTAQPPTAEIPMLSELARGVRIGARAPMGDSVVIDTSGLLVLRLRSALSTLSTSAPSSGTTSGTTSEQPAEEFAARFDALRAYTGTFQSSILERRGRSSSSSETLGGIATPLSKVRGEGDLIFGPRPGRQLNVCTLRDDVFFIREDTLLVFDLALSYENGRLPRTDEEPLAMVQLRGSGPVAFDVIERLRSLEVTGSHPVTVRAQSVVGWMGRILPRAVPIAEAPAGQRGLLGFAGDGTVFLIGK